MRYFYKDVVTNVEGFYEHIAMCFETFVKNSILQQMPLPTDFKTRAGRQINNLFLTYSITRDEALDMVSSPLFVNMPREYLYDEVLVGKPDIAQMFKDYDKYLNDVRSVRQALEKKSDLVFVFHRNGTYETLRYVDGVTVATNTRGFKSFLAQALPTLEVVWHTLESLPDDVLSSLLILSDAVRTGSVEAGYWLEVYGHGMATNNDFYAIAAEPLQ